MFTSEEPTRFGVGCIGSRALSGTLGPEKLAELLSSADVHESLRKQQLQDLAMRRKRPENLGWPTGFEPATTRSTIWGSNQAELRPPVNAREANFLYSQRQAPSQAYLAKGIIRFHLWRIASQFLSRR